MARRSSPPKAGYIDADFLIPQLFPCSQTADHTLQQSPTDNAFVESFNGTFRSECLNTHWFMNLKEVRQLIAAWRAEYNDSRPHASLADRTPSEFASQHAASRVLAGT